MEKIAIGKRIEHIRINTMKIKTKEEFAKLLGITGQHLGNIERGEVGISIQLVIDISRKTGVSTDYILLGKEKTIDKSMFETISSKYNEKEIDTGIAIAKAILSELNCK